MNVAVLQRHLSDLAGLLRQAGAIAPVVNGLTATAEALAPFAGYKVEQFAAFLKLADEYRRAGVTPDKVPARTTTRTTRTTPSRPARVTGNEVITRVEKLYAEILNPSFSAEHIEQELSLLDGLTKPDLLAAAERIGIKGSVQNLNKAPMIAAIKKAIRDRRGMFHRPTY